MTFSFVSSVYLLENSAFLHSRTWPKICFIFFFRSSLKILRAIIMYQDCFQCYFYCGIVILTDKERNKICPQFYQINFGKDGWCNGEKEDDKDIFNCYPFPPCTHKPTIILTSDFFAKKYSHSTVKSFLSMLGIIMSLC